MEATILELLLQGGAFAVLVWVIVHVFKKLIPEQQDSFQRTLAAQRDGFLNELQDHREQTLTKWSEFQNHMNHDHEVITQNLKDNTKSVQALSKVILYHDATVKGINPQVVKDAEDYKNL